MLVPKLVTTLRGYTRAQFTGDLTAGVIVGIVALPLSMDDCARTLRPAR